MGLAALNIGSPILSPIAWGYRSMGLIGLECAPIVYMPKSQIRVPFFDDSAFKLEDLEWQAPADKHQGESEITTNDYTMIGYERSAYVTDYEERNGANVLNLAMRRVQQKVGKIERNMENVIAGTLFGAANYAVTHTTALAGVTQWSNAASDPPQAIWTACAVVESSIGVPRSELTVVMGESTWNDFTAHAATLARIGAYQFLAPGFTPTAEMITPARAAAMLGVARVLVGKGKYRDDDPAAATPWVNFWNDSCAIYYVPLSGGTVPTINVTEGPTTPYTADEPSKMYTFRLSGHPRVGNPRYDDARDTTFWDVYDENLPTNMSTIAGYLYTNCS
jgi:hypothetical protein